MLYLYHYRVILKIKATHKNTTIKVLAKRREIKRKQKTKINTNAMQ